MIKFNCLIHKETGTVIKYEDWLKSTRDYLRIGEKKFNPIDILFSHKDDFEIIYDSEFTLEEIKAIGLGLESFLDEFSGTGLHHKEFKIIEDISNKIKDKYGIEV